MKKMLSVVDFLDGHNKKYQSGLISLLEERHKIGTRLTQLLCIKTKPENEQDNLNQSLARSVLGSAGLDRFKFLLSKGADFSYENNLPLKVAALSNKIDIMDLCCEKGADLSLENHLLFKLSFINKQKESLIYLCQNKSLKDQYVSIANDLKKQSPSYQEMYDLVFETFENHKVSKLKA